MTHSALSDLPSESSQISTIDLLPPSGLREDCAEHESRNLLTLAAFQICMRVGWIFKVESIIIPAFMDMMAGAGWMRGLLPVLNRFGQSIPPVIAAHRVKHLERKKWAVTLCILLNAGLLLSFAAMWSLGSGKSLAWMPWLFLLLYTLFFTLHGIGQLSLNTLHGKLIHATRRGRLMLLSDPLGTLFAVSLGAWLLPHWLSLSNGGFTYIFSFAAAFFIVASLVALLIHEPPDHFPQQEHEHGPVWKKFATSWQVLREDANFRRLAAVAVLLGTVQILMPHYQALGRQQLGLKLTNLMPWIVAQNIGAGLFSMFSGPLADRHGTRLSLRLLILGASLTPLVAIGMANAGTKVAEDWFWVVFIPMGFTPVIYRMLNNYTLEISPRHEHPRYLSTLNLCLAAPFLFSPLVGWLIDVTSFEKVLGVGSGLILLSFLLTFRLAEPRHV